MEITFTIPTWLLWTIGIPAAIAALVLAVIGCWTILNTQAWK